MREGNIPGGGNKLKELTGVVIMTYNYIVISMLHLALDVISLNTHNILLLVFEKKKQTQRG